LIIYLFPKITKAVPSTLVALLVVTGLAVILKHDVPVIGDIPTGIPPLHIAGLLTIDSKFYTLILEAAAALPKKLPSIPTSAAFELALRGHAAAAEQFAAAIRRAWWPILVVAALRSRRARWIAVAALAAAPTTALRDVAYGLGVWKGVFRHRTLDPLLPQLSSWPGQRRPLR
jgi:hypothetical protein